MIPGQGVFFMTTGYCVKCREKVDMTDEEKVRMRNGKKAIKGKCSVCGTEIYKIRPESREGMW